MARFCVKCGAQVQDNLKFCPNCGYDQNGGQTTKYSTSIQQGKSKLVAGLLGIFLGGFGIHNFYLGNTGRGVAQIIVTFLTCFTGALWGIIEGILILVGTINTDADGNPLVD